FQAGDGIRDFHVTGVQTCALPILTNNHQIALSSGNENSNLYLSFNYFDQVGVQKDQDYERFTANISGDIKPNEWLTVGASAIARSEERRVGEGGGSLCAAQPGASV